MGPAFDTSGQLWKNENVHEAEMRWRSPRGRIFEAVFVYVSKNGPEEGENVEIWGRKHRQWVFVPFPRRRAPRELSEKVLWVGQFHTVQKLRRFKVGTLFEGGRRKNKKKRGATRGLPRRSPILVLLSPKHA